MHASPVRLLCDLLFHKFVVMIVCVGFAFPFFCFADDSSPNFSLLQYYVCVCLRVLSIIIVVIIIIIIEKKATGVWKGMLLGVG